MKKSLISLGLVLLVWIFTSNVLINKVIAPRTDRFLDRQDDLLKDLDKIKRGLRPEVCELLLKRLSLITSFLDQEVSYLPHRMQVQALLDAVKKFPAGCMTMSSTYEKRLLAINAKANVHFEISNSFVKSFARTLYTESTLTFPFEYLFVKITME